MEGCLLTIGVPTYNRASLLKGLIENIFEEINRSGYAEDVQVLIVDGSSTDNTPDVIEELKQRGRLKYFRREKKEGIDRDILKCVELADGKYCWLFSDDDRLAPGAIGYLVDRLKNAKDLTGCFCNRVSYDSFMEKKVAEVKAWPGQLIKGDRIFTNKAECFKFIGMDFGFISSQVVKRSAWQKIVEGVDFGELYNSYYLMVHIIGKMMEEEFKWLYIDRPLVKQRTGNDTLLNKEGVIKRQTIEHESFEKILNYHYDHGTEEHYVFFKKMVNRLPRVIANLKSQNISYSIQVYLFKLLYKKYRRYSRFWYLVVPIFFIPNILFLYVKKFYFKYLV